MTKVNILESIPIALVKSLLSSANEHTSCASCGNLHRIVIYIPLQFPNRPRVDARAEERIASVTAEIRRIVQICGCRGRVTQKSRATMRQQDGVIRGGLNTNV